MILDWHYNFIQKLPSVSLLIVHADHCIIRYLHYSVILQDLGLCVRTAFQKRYSCYCCHNLSAPSLRKIESSRACTSISRFPGGTPRLPLAPALGTLIISPNKIPAGILTSISLSPLIVPEQVQHDPFTTRPAPLHFTHVDVNGEIVTFPSPLQVQHISGFTRGG